MKKYSIGLLLIASILLSGCSKQQSVSNATATPSGLGYYYCRDDGGTHDGYTNPHRIGHKVVGDHLCTKDELIKYNTQ